MYLPFTTKRSLALGCLPELLKGQDSGQTIYRRGLTKWGALLDFAYSASDLPTEELCKGKVSRKGKGVYHRILQVTGDGEQMLLEK